MIGRGVNHARERVEVEAKLALARGISAACLLAAVDLLSSVQARGAFLHA
jgi:hypothetical protein